MYPVHFPILLRKIFILIPLLIALINLPAQSCYKSLEAEGIAHLDASRYNEAVNSFFSAYRCTDRPRDHRIDELMQQVINKLKGVAEEAKQAARVAEQAKEAEANARVAEQKAKEIALANAAEAARNARQAESLRLALLADLEREKAQYRSALQLAYLALQLSNENNRGNAFSSFAKVVRDSFKRQLPLGEELGSIRSHAGFLLVEDENGLTIWDEGNWSPIARILDYENYTPVQSQPILILSAQQGRELSMYVMPERQRLHLSGQHQADLTFASSAGGSFVTSARDHTSIIWNGKGQSTATLQGHDGNIYQHLYWPAKEALVTRSSDGRIKLWSSVGEWQADIAEEHYIHDVRLAPDGSKLVAASADGRLLVWEASEQRLDPRILPLGQSPISKVRFLSDTGISLVSLDVKGLLQVWDQEYQPLLSGNSLPPVRDFIILEAPAEVLAWDISGNCYIIDQQGQLQKSWRLPEGNVQQFTYAPLTRTLLSSSWANGRVSIRWWLRSGEQLLSWEREGSPDGEWSGLFSTTGNYVIIPNPARQAIEVMPLPENVLRELEDQNDVVDRASLEAFQIQVWPD